jgi:ABC-2 type transport system ATP-binding protein
MIQCENVTLRYRKQEALKNVSFTLRENAICGVLGRNGAGKTSLLALLAAYRRPTAGTVRVLGEDPYENPRVMPQVALICNRNEENNSLRVRDMFALSAALRPNWDSDYAKRLTKRFDLPLKKTMQSLSHGMRAAAHIVIGLAGRAPLTIYDEAYLGLDAAYRKLFIGEILEDYMRYPRTVLFSTHYIGEMEGLFSEAIILDRGIVIAHEDCDSLRQKGVAVTGLAGVADSFAAGRRILSSRALGGQKEIVLFGALSEAEKRVALQSGLTLSAPPLQDLFIHMTEKGEKTNAE